MFYKADAQIKSMRHKSWPYYPYWLEIFGKDRATGEQAADVMDFVNDIMKNGEQLEAETEEKVCKPAEVLEDEAENTVSKPSTSEVKKSKGKKRKSIDHEMSEIFESLGEYFQTSRSTMMDISKRIGYEQDAKVSRTEL